MSKRKSRAWCENCGQQFPNTVRMGQTLTGTFYVMCPQCGRRTDVYMRREGDSIIVQNTSEVKEHETDST